MAARLPGKKRKLKDQEKLFEQAEEKKNKKQVWVDFCTLIVGSNINRELRA